MTNRDHITILGGGPAGLATGFYAGKKKVPFTIYEARADTGGNANTIHHGDFHFDTGAHRFHDKDPEITRDVMDLLGDNLLKLSIPSHIYYGGKFIDFPLSLLNLLQTLSFPTLVRAALDLVQARLNFKSRRGDFESATVGMYGRTIAELFLLNYSEKLWGLPGTVLSTRISGARLKGMQPSMLLREIIQGQRGKPAHLEGTFYYPRLGYGMIVNELARQCGPENIHLNSPIQAVRHSGSHITHISIKGGEEIDVEQVVSTIPVSLLLNIMNPRPPQEYLDMAKNLKFRNLVLVVLFLNAPRITESATLYFPGAQFPFTRIYEPINRSSLMAPAGKTSLCIEYPCFPEDAVWSQEDSGLIEAAISQLEKTGLINPKIVLGGTVVRLSHAYPVLEFGIEEKVERLLEYLSRFSNLYLVGRNGRFVYTHVHDMLRFGKDVVDEISMKSRPETRTDFSTLAQETERIHAG